MADNIKQMAKEYKEILSNATEINYNNYDQIINLEEKQLDMLNALNFYNNQKPQQKKVINYCINRIYQALDILSKIYNKQAYSPNFRNPYIPNTFQLLPMIVNAQIDIFILIDKINDMDTTALKIVENTKLGLLSLLK
ncbi:MAG: hypothetical protein WCR54_00960 [Clostridia bacterium]